MMRSWRLWHLAAAVAVTAVVLALGTQRPQWLVMLIMLGACSVSAWDPWRSRSHESNRTASDPLEWVIARFGWSSLLLIPMGLAVVLALGLMALLRA